METPQVARKGREGEEDGHGARIGHPGTAWGSPQVLRFDLTRGRPSPWYWERALSRHVSITHGPVNLFLLLHSCEVTSPLPPPSPQTGTHPCLLLLQPLGVSVPPWRPSCSPLQPSSSACTTVTAAPAFPAATDGGDAGLASR
ncbi:hypothetical protein BHM03_00016029 [Ensete ventricosum]|nr:hypothetical protein BHM03_00016029 [Ensete ventricosum]